MVEYSLRAMAAMRHHLAVLRLIGVALHTQRAEIAKHARDSVADLACASVIHVQRDDFASGLPHYIFGFLPHGDVRATEAIDALLCIADQEQAAGMRHALMPVGVILICGYAEDNIGSNRVCVLELIHKENLVLLMEFFTNGGMLPDQLRRQREHVVQGHDMILFSEVGISLTQL